MFKSIIFTFLKRIVYSSRTDYSKHSSKTLKHKNFNCFIMSSFETHYSYIIIG